MVQLRPRRKAVSPQHVRPRRLPSVKSGRRVSNSPFLNLPAELRNRVYEFCMMNESVYPIRADRTLYYPTLSLVCRQIRNEYRNIYLDEAPRHATQIHVHITNFVTAGAKERLDTLRASYPNLHRDFTLRIFLTNNWEPRDLRSLCTGYSLQDADRIINSIYPRVGFNVPARWIQGGTTHAIEILFDRETFDAEACQDALLKLDRSVSNHGNDFPDWPRIEQAFWEAFEKYGPGEDVSTMKRSVRVKRRCVSSE